VVLVLLILILQLHSLRYAAVVLIGAPLSTVGGLLVLAATGIPLDVSSITGLILLVGLVVKNASSCSRARARSGLGRVMNRPAAARARLRVRVS